MPVTIMLAGKCFCGAVHYSVPDAFRYAMHCHCSGCRRTTGAAFKPFAGIERDKLALTRGQNSLLIYGEENAHDAHCKVCGSFLYSLVRDGTTSMWAWARWWTHRASGRPRTSS